MLTIDDPGMLIWRAQPANKQLTDLTILAAIDEATQYANEHARTNSTQGARDAIALFRLRWMFSDDPSDKRMLMDAIAMLTGECP